MLRDSLLTPVIDSGSFNGEHSVIRLRFFSIFVNTFVSVKESSNKVSQFAEILFNTLAALLNNHREQSAF